MKGSSISEQSSGSSQQAELPGMIGPYKIRKSLGSGAFGQVLLAFDAKLDRELALKVPHPGILNNAKATERFLREARAGARLHHPNIVTVFDVGQDGPHHYIASVYIKGQTLQDAREKGPWDFRRSAQLIQQLADALAYAHKQGIVHRDVKPANIMLDERGTPYLMDFGIACLQDAAEKLTQDGSKMGTPAYMAPEIGQGTNGKADLACDQYSLGVVLYELLCGKLPFEGHAGYVIHCHIHSPPPPPCQVNPKIPRGLDAICLKALAKKPAERYPDCEVMAKDLFRFLTSKGMPPVDASRTPKVTLPADAKRETKKKPSRTQVATPAEARRKQRGGPGLAVYILATILLAVSVGSVTLLVGWRVFKSPNGPPIGEGKRDRVGVTDDVTPKDKDAATADKEDGVNKKPVPPKEKIAKASEKPPVKVIDAEAVKPETVFGYKQSNNNTQNYTIDRANRICYVRLAQFSESTHGELRDVMKRLYSDGIKGLILDLRFNPGGRFDSSMKISDLFIYGGLIVTVRHRNGKEISYAGQSDGSYLTVPMVCLTNGKTSGASEIVAACLQDRGRALLMGSRSSGQMQGWDDGENLTEATIWRPSGRNLAKANTNGRDDEEWGVSPNKGYEIKLPAKELSDLESHLRRQEKTSPLGQGSELKSEFFDRQLDMALAYLRAVIK